MRLAAGLRPYPLGGAHSAPPDLLAVFGGPSEKKGKGKGRGRGEGKGKKGRERNGKEEERGREGMEGNVPLQFLPVPPPTF